MRRQAVWRYRYKSARVGGRPLGPRARLVATV